VVEHSPTEGLKPAKNATVLLGMTSGKADLGAWTNSKWESLGDGVMRVKGGSGDNKTKDTHADIRLHLEFKTGQEIRSGEYSVEVRFVTGIWLIVTARVTIWVEAAETRPDVLGSVGDSDTEMVSANDVIHTGVGVWPTENHSTELFSVPTRHANRNRQFLRCMSRHSDLIDTEVRVGADDRSSTEVDALSRKVAAEASLLSLEALR